MPLRMMKSGTMSLSIACINNLKAASYADLDTLLSDILRTKCN